MVLTISYYKLTNQKAPGVHEMNAYSYFSFSKITIGWEMRAESSCWSLPSFLSFHSLSSTPFPIFMALLWVRYEGQLCTGSKEEQSLLTSQPLSSWGWGTYISAMKPHWISSSPLREHKFNEAEDKINSSLVSCYNSSICAEHEGCQVHSLFYFIFPCH